MSFYRSISIDFNRRIEFTFWDFQCASCSKNVETCTEKTESFSRNHAFLVLFDIDRSLVLHHGLNADLVQFSH